MLPAPESQQRGFWPRADLSAPWLREGLAEPSSECNENRVTEQLKA